LHERAQQLSARALVEGLQPAEETWLREHQAACPDCAQEAAEMQEALQALRTVAVMVPRDLASRTQLRVRLRAQEISRTADGSYWLWMVAAASWLLGLFSAPLVWRAFAWAGGNFGVPKLALEMGFVIWWTVPALVAVGVVLHQRAMSVGTKGI
jgi:anti-sigma factor RsiW